MGFVGIPDVRLFLKQQRVSTGPRSIKTQEISENFSEAHNHMARGLTAVTTDCDEQEKKKKSTCDGTIRVHHFIWPKSSEL